MLIESMGCVLEVKGVVVLVYVEAVVCSAVEGNPELFFDMTEGKNVGNTIRVVPDPSIPSEIAYHIGGTASCIAFNM